MKINWKHRWTGGAVMLLAVQTQPAWANPSAEDALKLQPVQKDVEFDRPQETKDATIKPEQIDGKTGWVVRNAAQNILRRFVDTNGDNVVDMWCYYADGIEVYRDIDSNHDGKADQYRWLNTGGSRWGLDADQDGKIDSWKSISAEEVSVEVVRAIADRDSGRFNRLLITASEIAALGLGDKQSEELKSLAQDAPTRFRTYLTNEKSPGAKLASAGPKLKWLHFGGSMPGMVPSGTNGSTKDVIAYENVLAMVETDGKHDQVPIGTLVRIDNLWRLIDAPRENDDQVAVAGFFFKSSNDRQPVIDGGTGGTNPPPDSKLQEKLDALDAKIAKATGKDLSKLHAERADLIEKFAEALSGEDRAMWYKQLADSVSVAAQADAYPEGVERLKVLSEKLAKSDGELASYVFFRHLTADYYSKIQHTTDYPKVQEEWLANLKKFVEAYPKSNDAAEALLQLGIAEEFAGNEENAKKWYGQASAVNSSLAPSKKATGALTRLSSVGRVLNLTGASLADEKQQVALSSYKGKVIVLHYWASWCQPFKSDMAALRELQAKYAKELVMVGINLDDNKQSAKDFLAQNKLPWAHMWSTGGLDSSLANSLGIVTVPTVMLIDKQGRVVNRGLHVTELDKEVSAIVK